MTTTVYSSYRSDDILCNHHRLDVSGDYSSHSHDAYEFVFLKTGNIAYMIEGKVYHPTRNCLVLVRPGEIHSMKFLDHTTYERYDLIFDEKNLETDICRRIPRHVSMIHFDDNQTVIDLFEKTDRYIDTFDEEALNTLLHHLIEEILFHVLLSSGDQDPEDTYTVNPVIQQAVRYINKNITQPLSIDMICSTLYITKSHLHHLFMKYLKITPKKYILSKKLTLAQKKLHAGESATDVAFACGFTDYSTFYRDYKGYFGYAPSMEPEKKVVHKTYI